MPLLPPSDAQHRVLLPFYHSVSNKKLPHIAHLYRVKTVEEFEHDLDFLLKIAKPIDLQTLIFHTKNKIGFAETVFHLSFDDGLREIYDIIAPILLEKKIPATIFLNSDFIDNKNLMFRNKVSLLLEKKQDDKVFRKNILNFKHSDTEKIDILLENKQINLAHFLEKKQPYLTTPQIQELHNQGFTFGAHSANHPEYRYIDFAEQIAQTETSLAKVKEITGSDLRCFSFPFNDIDVSLAFFERMNLDISFGSAGVKNDNAPNHLQRIAFEDNEKALPAKQILASDYFYYHLRKMTPKATIYRK